MTEIATTLREREQLFQDLYTGVIPKRVPINIGVSIETCIQAAGLPVGPTLLTGKGMLEAVDDMVSHIHADMFPRLQPRQPIFAQLSGSAAMVMSKEGFMQHPESHCMEEDEYPQLIKDPYGFIAGTIVPRLLKRMGQKPDRAWMTFYKAMKAQDDMNMRFGAIFNQVSQKYGFYRVPAKYNGKCVCSIDQMTSQMRGFTGMLNDIKRRPEQVREAAEAMLPLILKRAEPAERDPKGTVFMPLHMASYMRPKEFETIYWPTFYKLLHGLAEKGHSCYCFCESNWERYVDFLQELPQFTRLHFEYGDPRKIKEKLGDKFILTGFYPLTLLRTGTKEQCVDKAKELLDILAPGGNYYFDFDKGILTLGDIVPENLYAVIDCIVEKGVYPNAGQPSMKRKTEDTIHPCLKDIPPVVSSHYTTREQFAQDSDLALESGRDIMFAMMEHYEDVMFNTVMGLI